MEYTKYKYWQNWNNIKKAYTSSIMGFTSVCQMYMYKIARQLVSSSCTVSKYWIARRPGFNSWNVKCSSTPMNIIYMKMLLIKSGVNLYKLEL